MHFSSRPNCWWLLKLSFAGWVALSREILFTVFVCMGTRFVFLEMLSTIAFALIWLGYSNKYFRHICIPLFFAVSITSGSSLCLAIDHKISGFLNASIFFRAFKKHAILLQFSFVTIEFIVKIYLVLTLSATIFYLWKISLLNHFVGKSSLFIKFFVIVFLIGFNVIK